ETTRGQSGGGRCSKHRPRAFSERGGNAPSQAAVTFLSGSSCLPGAACAAELIRDLGIFEAKGITHRCPELPAESDFKPEPTAAHAASIPRQLIGASLWADVVIERRLEPQKLEEGN